MAETGNNRGITEADRIKLLNGEPLVAVSYRDNDIIDASGAIFIAAGIRTIWDMLVDYNHLSEKIPKIVESRLIEDRGDEKVIDQIGKSGILFIEKSVRILLNVREDYPRHLFFDLIEGDFKIYRGQWTFEPSKSPDGTYISWQALLKPDFFAPPFLVSFVQHQDLPTILRAIKKLAETVDNSTGS